MSEQARQIGRAQSLEDRSSLPRWLTLIMPDSCVLREDSKRMALMRDRRGGKPTNLLAKVARRLRMRTAYVAAFDRGPGLV